MQLFVLSSKRIDKMYNFLDNAWNASASNGVPCSPYLQNATTPAHLAPSQQSPSQSIVPNYISSSFPLTALPPPPDQQQWEYDKLNMNRVSSSMNSIREQATQATQATSNDEGVVTNLVVSRPWWRQSLGLILVALAVALVLAMLLLLRQRSQLEHLQRKTHYLLGLVQSRHLQSLDLQSFGQ